LVCIGPVEPKHEPGVVDANDEKPVGVQRLARANQVVPPAFALGQRVALRVGVDAGHMV
jgi:hypothetical protein